MKLSAVVITFNEERNIRRCLESLQSIVDEIIVVDSFSTDQTEMICSEFGVRFYTNPFEGHIQQKNYAASLATGDYILSLDADEALSDSLKKSILEIKKNEPSKPGYSFNRLTNYCGTWVKHGGWYPDRKLRFWKKGAGQWGGLNPHDQFMLHEGHKVLGFLEGDLLHYSYYTIEEHYKQSYYFADIAAEARVAKGVRTSALDPWIHGLAKFFKMYFFQAGFLDGKTGFTIAKISFLATIRKYRKCLDLQ